MKVFDHETLLRLNKSSIQAGRNQNLSPSMLPARPQDRYWVNSYMAREYNGQQEVRFCVVLNTFAGQSAWLDVSSEEFAAIPEIDISDAEWETAMCVGNPPSPP